MSSRHSFFSSTVGSKLLVAVTGISLVGFLIAHLAGNLLVFLGPGPFNEYSHKLISNPLVYPAEAGLVLLFLAARVEDNPADARELTARARSRTRRSAAPATPAGRASPRRR